MTWRRNCREKEHIGQFNEKVIYPKSLKGVGMLRAALAFFVLGLVAIFLGANGVVPLR